MTLKEIKAKFGKNKVDYFKLGERVIAALLLVTPFTALADLPTVGCGQLNGVSCSSVGGAGDLIVTVINWALGFAFIIAVAMLIYGGFRYIVSAGNEDHSKKGKQAVINALIGLVIIILSYVIVQVISRTVSSFGNNSSPA